MPTRGKEKKHEQMLEFIKIKDLCQNWEHYAFEYIFKGKKAEIQTLSNTNLQSQKSCKFSLCRAPKEKQPTTVL